MEISLDNYFDLSFSSLVIPIKEIKEIKETKEPLIKLNEHTKTEENKSNSSEKPDLIHITGYSRNTLAIFRESFDLLYGLKFKNIKHVSSYTDNLINRTFVTNSYVGELADGRSIRIELNNCGVTVGIGKNLVESFGKRKYIGIYETNKFTFTTLATDLRWEFP